MHFRHYTGSEASDRLKMLIFEFSRSKLVKIDTSFVKIGKFWFLRQFWSQNQNAVRHFGLKLSTDFAEMQYQTKYECRLHYPKIWRKSEQYWRRESAATVFVQNGRHDVINSNFQKMRKTAQEDILESICVNFH